jgi:hypothetical protein
MKAMKRCKVFSHDDEGKLPAALNAAKNPM